MYICTHHPSHHPLDPAPQVCKAGLARLRKIWLSRHGESMYNTLARLGGDSTLSPRGEVYAYKLPDVLVDRVPLVRCGRSGFFAQQQFLTIYCACSLSDLQAVHWHF